MTRKSARRGDGRRSSKPAPADARPHPGRSDRPRVDWLSRALARGGVMPLEEAEDAIAAGRVSVSGRVVKQPLTMLKPGEVVKVDGHPVSLDARTRVIVLHKPADVVTSTADRHAKTVFELLTEVLPAELSRFQWHAVGRLDRNSTGLLLFTNDERFVAHVTSPETKLPKRYVAQLGADATEEKLAPLRRSMTLDGDEVRPAKVRLRGPREVEVSITEGKNHQVKRMLGAVGLPVLHLHREAIGELELDLEVGGWRELSDEELRTALRFPAG